MERTGKKAEELGKEQRGGGRPEEAEMIEWITNGQSECGMREGEGRKGSVR